MTLKAHSRGVKYTIGVDFKLTLRQRIQLLFCKELSVVVFEYKRKG